MIDIEGLQKDPRFLQLSPEEQQAKIAKAQAINSAAPTPTPARQSSPQPVPGAVAPGRSWEFPKALIPSRTQAGIDLGMLAAGALAPEYVAGEKALELAARLGPRAARYARPALQAARAALPTLLGAAGAKSEGESALSGALSGAGQTLAAEAGTRLIEGPLQRVWDTGKIARGIRKQFPWLGNVAGARGLERMFVQGEAIKRTGAKLAATKAAISTDIGPTQILLSPTMKTAFEEAGKPIAYIATPNGDVPTAMMSEIDDVLTLIGDMGWMPNGNPRTGTASPTLRRIYHQAVGDAGDALNSTMRGAGTKYINARREFFEARTLKDLFQPAGKDFVINPRGHVDVSRLQARLLEPEFADAVASSKRLQDFAKRVFRTSPRAATATAGKMVAGTDIPFGLDIRSWLFPGEMPRAMLHSIPGQSLWPRKIGRTIRPALRSALTIGGSEAIPYFLPNESEAIPRLLEQGIGQQGGQ